MPIYEPGLKELVCRNVEKGKLTFTADIDDAIARTDCIFIAVGTPMDANGCADLTALFSAFSMIAPHLNIIQNYMYQKYCADWYGQQS